MNTSNVSTQSPDPTSVYLTGSRRLDLLCWCVLLLLLLAISPSFRVYHKVAAIRVEAAKIFPDGPQLPVQLPRHIERGGSIRVSIAEQLTSVEETIHRFMKQTDPLAEDPAGTHLTWTIRYSENSPRLDQTKVLGFTK